MNNMNEKKYTTKCSTIWHDFDDIDIIEVKEQDKLVQQIIVSFDGKFKHIKIFTQCNKK